MAPHPDDAPKAQGVITETYRELKILVPEVFREHSTELLKNQKCAIDKGAVLRDDVDSLRVDYLSVGWAFDSPKHFCWHLNIPPIRREELCAKYPAYIPLSLIERKSFIIAGVFAIPPGCCFSPPFQRTWKDLNITWPCFEKLSRDELTSLPIQSATHQLEEIFYRMRARVCRSKIEEEVCFYMTNLEPYRCSNAVPKWWHQQLCYNDLKEFRKDELLRILAHLLFYYEEKVSNDVKNQMPWTAPIQEVWKEYHRSSFPEGLWQARGSSIHSKPPKKRYASDRSMSGGNEDEEGIHTGQMPQPKRQCAYRLREATTTQYDGTSGKPTDSLKPVDAFATFYPSESLLGTRQPQELRAQRIEHNALNYPDKAPRCPTVTHEDTHATVATNSEAISSIAMQPNHDYYRITSYMPTSINSYQFESTIARATTSAALCTTALPFHFRTESMTSSEPISEMGETQLQPRATPPLAGLGRSRPSSLSRPNDAISPNSSLPPPLTQAMHSKNKRQDVETHRKVIDNRGQYASNISTSSSEDEERVCPVSQMNATQHVLSTLKHSLKNLADNMPQKLTTAISTTELSGLNRMKIYVSSTHSKLSTPEMLQKVNLYMSSLGIVCFPGPVPLWWPPGVNHKEYTELNKEGLISVASYLLLNHRLQLRKDLQDLKPWTAVLRRQNIPSQKSQVDGSQLSKKVNKKDPDAPNTSTPPHPKPPLSQSAKMKNVLERLGIDKENSAHRSLQTAAKEARVSLSSDANNLPEWRKTLSTTSKPYKWDEISDTAKDKKCLEMAEKAPQELVQYYQIGTYRNQAARGNWVARCYLWHNFHNYEREQRNKQVLKIRKPSSLENKNVEQSQ